MMKIIAILLTALFFEAIGVVFLSKGLKEIHGPSSFSAVEIRQLVVSVVTNVNFLIGIFLEAMFFATLLYLMSRADVSFIWPLTALGFAFTTLAARFLLHEHVSPARWAGVALIIMGAALITWSEKVKTEAGIPPRLGKPEPGELDSSRST